MLLAWIWRALRYWMLVLRESFPPMETGQFLVGAMIPSIVIGFSIGSVVIFGFAIGFTAQQWALSIVGAGASILLIATPTRIGVRYMRGLGSDLVIDDQAHTFQRLSAQIRGCPRRGSLPCGLHPLSSGPHPLRSLL
jgi:hypothetical protein